MTSPVILDELAENDTLTTNSINEIDKGNSDLNVKRIKVHIV